MYEIIQKVKKTAKRENLTKWTINTYCYSIKQFLNWCNKPFNQIKKNDITSYLDYLIEKNYSPNSLNVVYSSIKFMFKVQRKNWRLYSKFSKKPKKLPTVLTKKEIKTLLNSINNEKHFLIIALMYSTGLRLSELCDLKIENIYFDEFFGVVRNGKGQKDRNFIVAKKLVFRLKQYIGDKKFGYLFLGNNNSQISRKSVYQIVKKYAKKAGIKKNVHPHTLRHSFATHIIENNHDINSLQRLLGHSKIETTNCYVHCARPKINILSPFDEL